VCFNIAAVVAAFLFNSNSKAAGGKLSDQVERYFFPQLRHAGVFAQDIDKLLPSCQEMSNSYFAL